MITSYRELEVYKKSYMLAKVMHKMTQKYPEYERYEIGSQIRRAAISIPLNIAEGYAKKSSIAEFKRFLTMASGSCTELEVLIEMSKDLDYIIDEEYTKYINEYIQLGKQINTLIKVWK